jgi:hypothetical protein
VVPPTSGKLSASRGLIAPSGSNAVGKAEGAARFGFATALLQCLFPFGFFFLRFSFYRIFFSFFEERARIEAYDVFRANALLSIPTP